MRRENEEEVRNPQQVKCLRGGERCLLIPRDALPR